MNTPLGEKAQGAGGIRPPSPGHYRLSSSPSFALVATLLMITVITGAAVAFFQSSRIERFVSRNYADLARAQMAAESGYALAAALIRAGSTNDHFLVVQNTNRQLFMGTGSNQSATSSIVFRYLPLFSYTTNPNSYSTDTNGTIVSAGNPFTNPPASIIFTNILPGGVATTSPAVAWVILTNAVGRTNARFAFWVEDLAGRLDLSVAGANGTNARRPTGTNAEELALWSLFNPSVELDADNAVVRDITNSRAALATPATARLISTSQITTNLLAGLATRLIHDVNEPDVVPFGFGYTNQGQLKPNLNRWITTNTAVTLIADHILINLPNFTNRAGGFMLTGGGGATNTNAYTGYAYLQTLAASMVDYADTDSDPTTDGTPLTTNRARPVYRGVDSYPFVNEINKRYRLISTNVATVEGVSGRMARVEVTDFIELWNPSSKSNTTGTLTFLSAHRQLITYGFLNASYTNPTTASNSSGPVYNGVTTNTFFDLTIPPNGFVTLACSPVTNEFFNPTVVGSPIFSSSIETNTSAYWVAWNGRFYDAALGGIFRNGGTLSNTTTILNRANLPGFIYRTVSPPGFGNPSVGDPRASIYLSRNLDANQFVGNSTFGGRNVRAATVQPNQPYYEVAPATWPDGGHNSLPGNPAPNDSTLPTAVNPVAYTNIPPGRISNSGLYTDVLELGAIFDPIQWRDPTLGSWDGKYTNLSVSGIADNGFGGGNTLRIGRAEHPSFNNNGLRGAQLLDLFTVNTNTSATNGFNRVPGRINLNTATPNTLRALAAGVVHVRDTSLNPGQTNYTISTNAVAAFITGVTDFRITKPFFSPAELPQITNGPGTYPANAVFGSRGFANVTAWNDAAAEEWFAKIYPLTTVRSRNFLIHVVGQAMTTNTNFASRPIATSRQVFQVYAEPVRDASGLTTNVNVRRIAGWSL